MFVVEVVGGLEKVEDFVAVLDWGVEGGEDVGAAEEVESNYGVELGRWPGSQWSAGGSKGAMG